MPTSTIEGKTMVRRKRLPIKWEEPKRRGGPSLTAKAVAEELNLSIESVHIYARRGPELEGLPAYMHAEDGRGWIRKKGAGHRGVELFFYPEDIQDFKNKHPFKDMNKKPVPYTPQERDLVIQEAEQIKRPDGSVNRRQLLRVLKERHGLHWDNGKLYQKFKQILDDQKYPLPPEMPRDTRARRRYRAS